MVTGDGLLPRPARLQAAAEGMMAQMLQSPDGGRQVCATTCGWAGLGWRPCPQATSRLAAATLSAVAAAAAATTAVGIQHHRAAEGCEALGALPCASCPSQVTKRNLRADFARKWAEYAAPEADGAWEMLSSPAVVEALGGVLQRLSGGRKPGGGGGSGGGGGQTQSRL